MNTKLIESVFSLKCTLYYKKNLKRLKPLLHYFPNVASVIKPNANERRCNANDSTYISYLTLFFFFFSKCNQFGVLFTDYENIFSIFHHHVRQKSNLKFPQRKSTCVFFKNAGQKRTV